MVTISFHRQSIPYHCNGHGMHTIVMDTNALVAGAAALPVEGLSGSAGAGSGERLGVHCPETGHREGDGKLTEGRGKGLETAFDVL